MFSNIKNVTRSSGRKYGAGKNSAIVGPRGRKRLLSIAKNKFSVFQRSNVRFATDRMDSSNSGEQPLVRVMGASSREKM